MNEQERKELEDSLNATMSLFGFDGEDGFTFEAENTEGKPAVETKKVTSESPAGFEDMYTSYEVEETVNEEQSQSFVAMTTIGVGTGLIFLAEGSTEQEAFNNGVAAILPLNMWQHASIYDVTKRKNMQVVTKSKARQLGYQRRFK